MLATERIKENIRVCVLKFIDILTYKYIQILNLKNNHKVLE
jgi:hypothetical protein